MNFFTGNSLSQTVELITRKCGQLIAELQIVIPVYLEDQYNVLYAKSIATKVGVRSR